MRSLFCITNRLSPVAVPCSPWDYVPSVPDGALESKEAFDKWSKLKDTKHCFYFGYECMNPAHRPGRDNKPYTMAALIADYDTVGGKTITDAEVESIKAALPEHLWPTYVHRTFRGGARLVWVFEQAVPVGLERFRELFVEYAAYRVLKLDKLLPGLDTTALYSSVLTYDVGSVWRQMGGALPPSITEQWCYEAADRLRLKKSDLEGPEIPLEEIEQEVEARFPGRWSGPFEVGRRGPVFFREDSKNPTAALVTEKGMICFSTEKLFHSWADIFGARFVDAFVQDKVGRAVVDVFFDGRQYWYCDARGRFVNNTKEVLVLSLRNAGLDAERPRKGGLSEVDAAMHYIHQRKRVDKIAPLVYVPRRVFDDGASRTLNISHLKVMDPADGPCVWGPSGQFPWLSALLDQMFDEDQRPYFLAWWRWYYLGALRGQPNKGHAMFLSGPVESAKTFLSNVVVGLAMGGHYPATKFLLGDTQFNKGPSESSLWTVDDSAPAHQDTSMAKFAERVKQLVVNGSFEVRAMYRDGVDIFWSGRRLMITLNEDPVSLRMLPPLDTSIDDKVMFLKVTRPSVEFSQNPDENDARVRAELPFFLRWMVDWAPPESVLDARSRLAVRSKIHDDLRAGSLVANGVTDFLQVIDVWFQRRRLEESEEELSWTGTAADLLSSMTADHAVKELLRAETVRTVGRKLGMLVSVHSNRVAKSAGYTSAGGSSRWVLSSPWAVAEIEHAGS